MTTQDIITDPSGIPPRPIHERQLDDDMLKLQRASTVSHRHGQRLEAVRNTTALVLAAIGFIVTATGHGRAFFAALGVAWFLISAFLLKSVMSSTAKEGALLQEQFDTTLFQMPWRTAVAGDPLPDHDIVRLARKLKQGSKRDRRITSGWYDPTHKVYHPLDVLIAQEQNLAWDARLRRSYSNWIIAAAAVWAVIGLVVVGIFGSATVLQAILSFYAPSAAAFQLATEIASGQRRVASERERLAKIVLTELRNAQPGPLPLGEYDRLRAVARDLQDGIFRTRLDVSRVPEWFYRRARDTDERDFADTAEGHRKRLAE
jgi:hypothetical protein